MKPRILLTLAFAVALAPTALADPKKPLKDYQLQNSLDANGQQITNLPAPVSANDAARKAYVDGFRVSYPSVAFVFPGSGPGNDTTAQVGNPSKPYLTAQAALAAGATHIHVLSGDAGTLTITTAGDRFLITGALGTSIRIVSPGSLSPGSKITIQSDRQIRVQLDIRVSDGAPGAASQWDYVILHNLLIAESSNVGLGGTSDPYAAGATVLIDCISLGALDIGLYSSGGSPGNVYLLNTIIQTCNIGAGSGGEIVRCIYGTLIDPPTITQSTNDSDVAANLIAGF